MKTVSDNYAAKFSINGGSFGEPHENFPFDRIGDDLRHLYEDVIETEMPRSLQELAEAVDALLAGAGRGE